VNKPVLLKCDNAIV